MARKKQSAPKTHFFIGGLQWRPNEPEYEQLVYMEVTNFINARGKLISWDDLLERTNATEVLTPFVLESIEEASLRAQESGSYGTATVAAITRAEDIVFQGDALFENAAIVLQARSAIRVFSPPGLFKTIYEFRDFAVRGWRALSAQGMETPLPLELQQQEEIGAWGQDPTEEMGSEFEPEDLGEEELEPFDEGEE